MEITTNPPAKRAAEVEDFLRLAIGSRAPLWMVTLHKTLGTSPVLAIKDGRIDDVWACAKADAALAKVA